MTVGKYLEQLTDPDAERAATLMDRALYDCPLTTPVGEHCKKIIDATVGYLTIIEETTPTIEAECRWEIWWHARMAMTIVYFG